MKKILFWVGHHWVVTIIVLVGIALLQILYANDEQGPWWTPFMYGVAYMLLVLTSVKQYHDWKRVFKKRYMEM